MYAAITVAAIDLVFQAWDLYEERRARRGFGGLSTFEYSLHVWLTGLHVAALALTLAARPAGDWLPAATGISAAFSGFAREVAEFLLPGAGLAAVLHFVLLLPRFRRGVAPPPEQNRSTAPGLPPLF